MPTIVRTLLLALSLALPALALADADGAEGKGRCAHCAQGEKKETCGCASGEKAGGCPHCAKGGPCEDCCGACRGEDGEGACPHCAGEGAEAGCACAKKAGKSCRGACKAKGSEGGCPHCAKGGEGACPHCAGEGAEAACACGKGKADKECCGACKARKGCACDKKGERAQAGERHEAGWSQISISELEALQAEGAVTVFDANGDELRRKEGTIPGAVLLPTSSNYDLALLPADKDRPLVFYCANQRCTAAHTAADRAVQAGYQKVSVLPAGILGWKEAGKPTARIGS